MAKSANTIQSLIGALPEQGDKPAIIAFQKEGPECLAYKDLFTEISSLAGGLAEDAAGRNRIIAVCGSSSPAWITVALAVINSAGRPADR